MIESTVCDRCSKSEKMLCQIEIPAELTQNIESLPIDIFFNKTNWGFLCKHCINHFSQLISVAQTFPLPTSRSHLTQGIHYYIENELWVFTELYHYLKNNCCQNGCRHCVYGYRQ